MQFIAFWMISMEEHLCMWCESQSKRGINITERAFLCCTISTKSSWLHWRVI